VLLPCGASSAEAVQQRTHSGCDARVLSLLRHQPPPTHSVRRSGGWTQQSRVRRAHRRHLDFSPPSCVRYAHESQPQLSHTAAAPSPFIPPLDPSAPLERFRTNAHMPVSQHTSLSPEQFPAVTSPSPRPKPSLTPQHSSRPAKDPKPYLDVCFPTLHPTLPPARQVDPANTYQTGSISCASGCERLKHLNPLSHTPIHRIRRAVAKRYIHVLISQPSTRWLWALLEKSARTGCFHPAAPLLTSYKGSYHPSRSQAACWTTSSSYPTEEAPRAPSLCGGVSAVGRA
jgi:hypothetical protein